jgi:hypothetical protein
LSSTLSYMAANMVVAVNNFGDTESGGLAGPMGLLVIVVLVIATVLLIRNMNKRLRRLPDSFEREARTEREAEIARLNADLERSGTEQVERNVDRNRSVPGSSTAEDEVKGVTTEGDGGPSDGDTGRV